MGFFCVDKCPDAATGAEYTGEVGSLITEFLLKDDLGRGLVA